VCAGTESKRSGPRMGPRNVVDRVCRRKKRKILRRGRRNLTPVTQKKTFESRNRSASMGKNCIGAVIQKEKKIFYWIDVRVDHGGMV